jgi:tetratricopeptide (TPR) repeat protein
VDRVLAEWESATSGLRTPLARWLREAAHAMRALLDGRLADAESHVVASLRHAERAQSPNMDLQALVQLVYLRVEQGRAHEIEAATRGQMQRFPDTAAWRSALAALLAAAGQLDDARRELARLAREDFTDVPRDRGWLPTLAFAAEVAHATGNAATAERLHALLSPYARLCVVAGSLLFYGSVSHHLGILAATVGRDEDALVHLERARDVHERIGARAWSARTELAMAELLARRGGAGDGDRAADLAAAAVATARALGLERIAAAARRFDLPRLRAVPRP